MTTQNRIDNLTAALNNLLETSASQTAVLDKSADLVTRAARSDDYRQVVNLMGRYASYHYYAEHMRTYNFFSHSDPRTTAELGSTGIYAELDKIYQMFLVYHDYNNLPHTAHCHPLTTPYVLIAGDRGTAKIFMLTNGFECLPGPTDGPQLCMWFYDGYDMDFVREDTGWKWLRFHMVDDIKAPFHISWGEAGKHPAPSPAGLIPPTYYSQNSFQPYNANRKPTLCVRLPEPYETY